ncbi:PREDICTED: uncharacterized protein LOC106325298 isoform X2 [Brassica oleracea var. oleracea]|uniref:DUF4378 domain-containing protein n=1 Tax=Brassica oleracea var. oleracea TaxID=109376 RepID=A0A0D3AXD1_BRAOL|nr:PREDICTED: uncharacterized protein LOC106325298 isoform X2 [Brassica oleracea var. oleracea]
MEVVERKRSRGGFLNLFDWPGKSRKKKLFSSGSLELSEEPSKTKQNAHNLFKPSLNEVDEIGKNWNYNSRSDSSCCASSVTSDDGQGTRAPSVVARLMGLESLPVPNVKEPVLDPFFFRHSLNTNKWNAYENLGYVNLRSDYDDRNRPVERFQSETFPPRSAKPISVAKNRLLSPIRSPGLFVPSRNPVYVMEAASRMIEPSPRMVTRTRFSSPSDSPSTSVPMRIQDLREKLKAAKKVSSRQVSSNNTFNEKRASTSVTTKSSPDGLKSKARPPHVSAAQAKASTTPLRVIRNSPSHKEKAEPKKRIVKSGLKQKNEQKQNCKDNHRLVNKVPVERGSISKQSGLRSEPAGKNASLSLSRKKTLPRSKKPPNGMQECGIKRGESVIKCNIASDGGLHSGKDDRRKEVNVITSPVKGLSSDSLSSTQVTDQDTDSAASFDMFVGGNPLKLRELTSKLESSSSCCLTQEESSRCSEKDGVNGMFSSSSESESISDKQKLQMMHAEEHEVSTVTEPDDLRSSCSKGFSDCRQTTKRLDWEVEYICEIIGSDQLMVKEFALGMDTDILPASLFKELEGCGEPEAAAAAAAKLKRKTLFDFVNKSLAVKCEQMFRGSCRGILWREGILFEHRDWLAEELNREIHGLKKMREMMMDELVEKEMSSLKGSWLDFERETYEKGVDIEGEMVSKLVDDLVNELVSVFKEEH